MTAKIRVPPEKGTEIVSDGGKKKNNFLLAFLNFDCTFSSHLSTRDISMSGFTAIPDVA